MKPNAHSNTIKKEDEGTFIVSVRAAPVEGKANRAVLEFLTELLDIPKSQIVLMKGTTSRYKTYEIPDSPDIRSRLEKIT